MIREAQCRAKNVLRLTCTWLSLGTQLEEPAANHMEYACIVMPLPFYNNNMSNAVSPLLLNSVHSNHVWKLTKCNGFSAVFDQIIPTQTGLWEVYLRHLK